MLGENVTCIYIHGAGYMKENRVYIIIIIIITHNNLKLLLVIFTSLPYTHQMKYS